MYVRLNGGDNTLQFPINYWGDDREWKRNNGWKLLAFPNIKKRDEFVEAYPDAPIVIATVEELRKIYTDKEIYMAQIEPNEYYQ